MEDKYSGVRHAYRPLIPKAAKLHAEGKNQKEIAEALGVSAGTIKNWKDAGLFKEEKVETPIASEAPKRFSFPRPVKAARDSRERVLTGSYKGPATEKELEKAQELFDQGYSTRVVAEKIGRGESTISHWVSAGKLQKKGYKPRGKSKVRHETMEIPLVQEFQAVSTLTISGDAASIARFMKEIRS